MAADKTLVDGAYRAAMANVTKDTTKISMMEGASITKSLVGGITMQAKKAQAAKATDKDLKAAMGNLAYAGIGDDKFAVAGKDYFSKLNWKGLNLMEREAVKAQTKMMGAEGKDFAKTVSSFMEDPEAFKSLEGTGGIGRDGTKERFAYNFNEDDGYELSYGKNQQLMVKFKGEKEPMPWKEWKNTHLKENTDEADATFMKGLRKEIVSNGKQGLDFELGGNVQKITEAILQDDIDINHFSKKKMFKMNDKTMGTFKDVLMENPEAQQAILKGFMQDPSLALITDIDGIKGVTDGDLQMLLANEEMKYGKTMSNLVDAITNPKNPLYNTELAQEALSSTIALDLQNSSHAQGINEYNKGTAQVVNRGVEGAVQKQNLQTAQSYSLKGAFDIRKLNRINPKVSFELAENEEGNKEYQISNRGSIDGTTTNRIVKRLPLEPPAGYTFQEYQAVLMEEFQMELGSKNTQL